MDIKYHSDDKLIVEDKKRELSFMDLAKVDGYQLEENPNHYWIIYQYKELLKDKKIEFELGRANYLSGKIAELYFGYFINSINRRTIKLNKDGTVKEDTITIFNPINYRFNYDYKAFINPNIRFEDYLSEDSRYYYRGKEEIIMNHILNDSIIEQYNYYNNRYCNLLNYYSDNYKILKDIFCRFDDEWYLSDLELDIKKNKSSSNALKRKLDK